LCVIALIAQSVEAADGADVWLELTVAAPTMSYSSSAAWGWWSYDKFDVWMPEEDGGTGIVGARITSAGEKYVLLLAGEWFPDLKATASSSELDSTAVTSQDLTTQIEVYDLGYGRWLGRDAAFTVMPWGAVTHMRIDENRIVGGESGGGDRETAESLLWGVGVGADLRLRISKEVAATGRVVMRWATGDREAWVSSGTPQGGSLEEPNVKLTDSTSRAMYGAEFGVRWRPVRWLAVEGGWWYRDWTIDGGPAAYDGPFLRAAVGF